MQYVSKSLEETRQIAKDFLNGLESGERATVVALQGDLGAGKTAFTQAVGAELGINGNMQSPTFVIMKTYRLQPTINNKQQTRWSNLIHVDAYRLERDEELLHLGWEELTSEPENLIFIEWPENVPGVIPGNALRINMEFVDDSTRKIDIK